MQGSKVGDVYSDGITFIAHGIGSDGLTPRKEQWIYAMKKGKLKLAKKYNFS